MADKKRLNESYDSKFRSIVNHIKKLMPKETHWSYDDYRVVGDDLGGGIRFQVEFDSKDSSLQKRIMDSIEDYFYGVHCGTGWGRDWDYYISVNVDEKACNESLNKSNKLTLNEDLFEESYWNPKNKKFSRNNITEKDLDAIYERGFEDAFYQCDSALDAFLEERGIDDHDFYVLLKRKVRNQRNYSNKPNYIIESLNKGIREDVEPEGDDIVFTPDDSLIDNGEVVNTEKPDEQTPETPEDNGVARLILHAINGETDTIAEYNDLIANTDNEDIIRIIQDITAEENNHIGMLQKALELISPNASNIDGGMKEAEGMIEETGEVVEESLTEDLQSGDKRDLVILNERIQEEISDMLYIIGKEQEDARKKLVKASFLVSEAVDDCVGGADIDESLTEADTLHQKFKKDIKNEYKSWASRQERTEQKRKDMMDILNDHEDISDETRDMWTQKVNDLYPNQEFEYDFPRNLEKIDYPFYVTYYAEYPIYEPAEGGYYYAGNDAIWSEGFNTEEEAWEYANKYVEQDDEWGDWQKFTDGYKLDGKYIGQNQYVVVEPKKSYLGMVKGWEPYQ